MPENEDETNLPAQSIPRSRKTRTPLPPCPPATTLVTTRAIKPRTARRRRGADAALRNGLDRGPGYTIVAHVLALLARMAIFTAPSCCGSQQSRTAVVHADDLT
jgi:hypothetical protein